VLLHNSSFKDQNSSSAGMSADDPGFLNAAPYSIQSTLSTSAIRRKNFCTGGQPANRVVRL
jgi:hypothetical protein